MTDAAKILEDSSAAGRAPYKWIYTKEGTTTAHHCYLKLPRDKEGKPVKGMPIPVVRRDERATADWISTCLWHPVQSKLYLYSVVVDIDKKETLRALLNSKGQVCPIKLRDYITQEMPRTAPYLKMVWSTHGQGIHLWLFFPAFALDDEKSQKQTAMATKSLKALRRILQSGGYGADDKSLGLHHLYSNWRNQEKHIDRDIELFQARTRRSLDPEHKQYQRVLGIAYNELSSRADCKDIFAAPLKKLYRTHKGISDKLRSFALQHYEQLSDWQTIRMRSSELVAALGISKNTLPKLISPSCGLDQPTLGIRIERDLLHPGYYEVTRTDRFDGIRPPSAPGASKKSKRSGTVTERIDVIEPLKYPEDVQDGERHHEVVKAALKLKLSGVDVDEAVRVVSIYAHRAIKEESETVARCEYFVRNVYSNQAETKGKIPHLAPNWLLSITSDPYPKSLKGALKSRGSARLEARQQEVPPPTCGHVRPERRAQARSGGRP